MGGVLRNLRALGPTIALSGLRTEPAIVQVGDKLLAGLDAGAKSWIDQQAALLAKKPRFGARESAQLSTSVATRFPKLDAVSKEKMQLAVVYLALRASAPKGLNAIATQPASRTPFQNDILAG